MPVTIQDPVASYVANGATTNFTFPFRILAEGDLKVYVDGVEQVGGYTITGVGDQNGGSIAFTVAPAANAIVRLQRINTIERVTDYLEGGGLSSKTLDDDFDRIIMILQDIDGIVLKETSNATFDFGNRRITGVADAVDGTDAVNKQTVTAITAGDAAAAAASASAAATSETNAAASSASSATSAANASASAASAATSASNAATSEANAATSETNAATSEANAASAATTIVDSRIPTTGAVTGSSVVFDGSSYVPSNTRTDSLIVPAGTTAQRSGTPSTGSIRFNSDLASFEGYTGSQWGSIGGGAVGGGANAAFYENDATVTDDYTITSGKNAMSAGPITINNGVTVTVPTGSVWKII